MSAAATRSLLQRYSTVVRPASSSRFLSIHNTHINTNRFSHSTAPVMTVHEIKSKADFDTAIKEHKTVVLDATATWCGPCKMISPVLEKLSNQPSFESIYFAKFDVDDVSDLTNELGVRAMPSFFVFQGGEKADSLVGANPKALEALVTKYA